MAAIAPLLTRPFCFVRHGESEANLQGLVAGSTDVPLTDLGRTQAFAAAHGLRGAGITSIYCSLLSRARETASRIGQVLGLPVTEIPELGERNWGALEGQPRALRVRGATPRGAETPDQFRARVLAGLARIDDPGLPLIVAHSGVFRVLCSVLGATELRVPVANARPLRWVPPVRRGQAWTVEPL